MVIEPSSHYSVRAQNHHDSRLQETPPAYVLGGAAIEEGKVNGSGNAGASWRSNHKHWFGSEYVCLNSGHGGRESGFKIMPPGLAGEGRGPIESPALDTPPFRLCLGA